MVLLAGSAFGQQDLLLYNMPMIFQSTYANPGQSHYYEVHTGLPISSIYLSATNTGFKYMDLLSQQPSGLWRWDLDKVSDRNVKLNHLMVRFDLDRPSDDILSR